MTSRDPHSTPQDETEQPPAQVADTSGEGRPSESEVSSSNEQSATSHEHEPLHSGDSPHDTQSNFSDITLQSRIPHAAGGEGGSVESDTRGSSEHMESTSSVTFPVHSRHRPSDESDHSGHPSWSPSSPSSQLPSREEITEVSPSSSTSSDQEEPAEARSGSEVSIGEVVPDTPSRKTPKLNSRKRRHFWPNLKLSGGNLRKRLCCCFPTKPSEETNSSSGDEEGFKIRSELALEEGILRSKVAMNSVTVRQVEEVIRRHGDFIVLTGERLRQYEQRMSGLLATHFERESGYEILRLWRMDATRPSRVYVDMLPSQSSEQRILTLGDVRLLDPPRDEHFDPRDDSLFRYFMSCEGLSRHNMLIPGRA